MSTAMTTSNPPPVVTGKRQVPERRGILYIISAPSGAGKTTLCKQIVTSVSGVWHSVSFTTRKPRPGEEHGRDYFFIEEKVFHDMVARNEFLEYAHVYSHWYGTPRKPLMDRMEQGIDVLRGDALDCLLFGDQTFIRHLDGDLHSRLGGALAIAGLEHP